jgi:hypothetical protein
VVVYLLAFPSKPTRAACPTHPILEFIAPLVFGKGTHHEALHCTVFSTPLSLPLTHPKYPPYHHILEQQRGIYREATNSHEPNTNMGKKWNIHLHESKSVHTRINFTNRLCEHIPVTINNQNVPYANTAKYLGMTLDAKLRLKAHVKKKRRTGTKIPKKCIG